MGTQRDADGTGLFTSGLSPSCPPKPTVGSMGTVAARSGARFMPQEESELLELGWFRNPLIALKKTCAVGGRDSAAVFFPLIFHWEGGKMPVMGPGGHHQPFPSLCKHRLSAAPLHLRAGN